MPNFEKEQVAEAIAEIVAQKAYVPLRETDFREVCPNPYMIHVVAADSDSAVRQIEHDINELGLKNWSGVIVFMQGSSLSLSDIDWLDKVIPRAARFRRGLGSPEYEGVEVWIFLQEG
ncbi:MAG: hypothetical protein IKX60_09050 [Bacteroidales bacterium]|nr:hypothetical protein [Bacteroidales bacterium]